MEGKRVREIRSPDTERANRLPPGQRGIDRLPVLHEGRMPKIDLTAWRLTISGSVEQERELGYEEFCSLPRVEVRADIHCVEGWSKLNVVWEGVGSRTVENLVKVRPEAAFVLVHGARGYSINLSLADFLEEDVVLADTQDGEHLTPEHGFPLRLVVPRLYFWKSAKWVTGVEFRAEEQLGYWESRGYHPHGDPWKEERFSRR